MNNVGGKPKTNKKRPHYARIVLFIVSAIAGIAVVLFIIKVSMDTAKVVDSVTIEAGSDMVDVKEFLKHTGEKGTYVTNPESINTSVPGEYKIYVNVGNKVYKSKLIIEDTIAPEITPRRAISWNGNPVDPSAFVGEAMDATELKYRYITEPDYSLRNDIQVIIIRCEDMGGNSTSFAAELVTDTDTTPPVITGAYDQIVYVGNAITYKRNVSVTDDKDSNPVLTIDDSYLDPETPGRYRIIYTATDEAGNSSSITVIYTVKASTDVGVDLDELDNLADGVLDGIIKPGMSKLEKTRAIYNWIRDNIVFVDTSDKTDWTKEAYNGLSKRKGDCFTYFASSQILLARVGIQCISVSRSSDTGSRHYWSLVNIGDGWYHFDATPHFGGAAIDSFMLTDAQLAEYASEHAGNVAVENYYRFDKDKYPARAETIINNWRE